MRSYTGIVIKGQGRATALGFPTANIVLEDGSMSGIYAAKVKVGDAEYMAAVFADPKRKLLEAHILDVVGELYGKEITIEFCEQIPDNNKFSNDKARRLVIEEAIVKVRNYLAINHTKQATSYKNP